MSRLRLIRLRGVIKCVICITLDRLAEVFFPLWCRRGYALVSHDVAHVVAPRPCARPADAPRAGSSTALYLYKTPRDQYSKACWLHPKLFQELNLEPEFCPYEVDLLSHMVFVMKQF